MKRLSHVTSQLAAAAILWRHNFCAALRAFSSQLLTPWLPPGDDHTLLPSGDDHTPPSTRWWPHFHSHQVMTTHYSHQVITTHYSHQVMATLPFPPGVTTLPFPPGDDQTPTPTRWWPHSHSHQVMTTLPLPPGDKLLEWSDIERPEKHGHEQTW